MTNGVECFRRVFFIQWLHAMFTGDAYRSAHDNTSKRASFISSSAPLSPVEYDNRSCTVIRVLNAQLSFPNNTAAGSADRSYVVVLPYSFLYNKSTTSRTSGLWTCCAETVELIYGDTRSTALDGDPGVGSGKIRLLRLICIRQMAPHSMQLSLNHSSYLLPIAVYFCMKHYHIVSMEEITDKNTTINFAKNTLNMSS